MPVSGRHTNKTCRSRLADDETGKPCTDSSATIAGGAIQQHGVFAAAHCRNTAWKKLVTAENVKGRPLYKEQPHNRSNLYLPPSSGNMR